MTIQMPLPKMEVPTYEIILPSTNKKIKYRPFLVKEHKILMMLKDSNIEEIARVIRELIDNCTFGKLKVDKLPHFDIEYIFLNLRSRSIGEILNLSITCECGNEIPVQANLNEIKVVKNEIHTKKIRFGNI
ncbi:baseplate protein, partial [bacterium]|nr:baseplate protein [bacterium]